MPPKIKINKENILKTAFILTQKNGFESITARQIAKELNCSTQPIFSAYRNMSELKNDLFDYSDNYLGEYLIHYQSSYNSPLLDIGLAYIDFARKEKNLFRLIFFSNSLVDTNFIEYLQSGQGQEIFNRILNISNSSLEETKKQYLRLFIFVHGLATLISTNQMDFSEQTIIQLLYEEFLSSNSKSVQESLK